MRRREVTALLDEVEQEVIRFAYEEHHFARVLLRLARVRHGSYEDLRRSPFARLLERPNIRRHFSRLGPEAALAVALADEPAERRARPYAFLACVASVLAPHARFWAEATLTAALWWLVERRGIRRIFYNSWETGNALKNLRSRGAPPRSLYADLPRRFCFEQTRQIPKALARSKVPAVQRHLRDAKRAPTARLCQGGPWQPSRLQNRCEPRWFLLEL